MIDKRLAKLRNATHLVANEQKALSNCDSPFVSGLRYAFATHEVRVCVISLLGANILATLDRCQRLLQT